MSNVSPCFEQTVFEGAEVFRNLKKNLSTDRAVLCPCLMFTSYLSLSLVHFATD